MMLLIAGLFAIFGGTMLGAYGVRTYWLPLRISRWSLRRRYYLFSYLLIALATIVFGLALLGIRGVLPLWIYLLNGVAWILYIPTPCSEPQFNQGIPKWVRAATFFALGSAFFSVAYVFHH